MVRPDSGRHWNATGTGRSPASPHFARIHPRLLSSFRSQFPLASAPLRRKPPEIIEFFGGR